MIDRKEAYRMAIANEIKSQNLYNLMSKGFKNRPETAVIFNRLVTMEKMHEEKLREAFHNEYPKEGLEFDGNMQFKATADDIEDPKKVLEFAISREETAGAAYREMADESSDVALKELLTKMASEEEYHKTILETEINMMQGLLIWFDPSELSGLVEH